ncbi:hypothetical protein E2C01_035255 [Portunus trituberculatus]|uniref:Uncharacterized protein n=1 Tax=Portunus trituberculatus TaxID=210409 RepID=A0A5B7F7V0_PORTR|nr:hypothetical protein [Portunus trituberculatus]
MLLPGQLVVHRDTKKLGRPDHLEAMEAHRELGEGTSVEKSCSECQVVQVSIVDWHLHGAVFYVLPAMGDVGESVSVIGNNGPILVLWGLHMSAFGITKQSPDNGWSIGKPRYQVGRKISTNDLVNDNGVIYKIKGFSEVHKQQLEKSFFVQLWFSSPFTDHPGKLAFNFAILHDLEQLV